MNLSEKYAIRIFDLARKECPNGHGLMALLGDPPMEPYHHCFICGNSESISSSRIKEDYKK